MRLKIVCKNAELTEELKAFAQEKIDRLERFFEGVMKAQVILSPDFVTAGTPAVDEGDEEPAARVEKPAAASGHVAAAELVLTLSHGAPLVARARGENFRAAIDIAADK
ncbi:MAG: HPF/RaiA family ribosome-associated protein, partial [Planctomycetota bacterium]